MGGGALAPLIVKFRGLSPPKCTVCALSLVPSRQNFFAWTAGYEATIITCAAYIAKSAERVYSVIAIAVAPLQSILSHPEPCTFFELPSS